MPLDISKGLISPYPGFFGTSTNREGVAYNFDISPRPDVCCSYTKSTGGICNCRILF